jgi:hypothetical protein
MPISLYADRLRAQLLSELRVGAKPYALRRPWTGATVRTNAGGWRGESGSRTTFGEFDRHSGQSEDRP